MNKPKKIIITQNALHFFAGSEIVTLELAEFLQKSNMEVVVFTWYLANPMKREFERRGIKVTTDDNDPLLKDADYVWVNHQIIPTIILESLTKINDHPQFIFMHMSALENLYLEQTYVYDLEHRLSSESLFMADEAYDTAKKYYYQFDKIKNIGIFPNPVPDSFLKPCPEKTKLRKILIISNHPVKEIAEACNILAQDSIKTELLGKDGTAKLISYDILSKYDLIITVAKSVQYCLCTGTPVYVYDHFGGPGYLDAKNFEVSRNKNFSGRGFSKKSVKEIVEEITKGYDNALEFQTENRKKFCEEYSLKNQVEKVFANLKPHKIEPFSKQYLHYVQSVEGIARDKVVAENGLTVVLKDYEKFREAYNKSAKRADGLQEIVGNQQKELESARHELAEIKNRKSYGIIRGIDKVAKAVKRPKDAEH